MKNKHDVCIALDKLTVEMLSLMEQKVQSQINIENATKNGSFNLAKSRYIMGQQTVSCLQLPTENTPDFHALATVEKSNNEESNISYDQYSLNNRKSENNSSYINPIKWFGVLVPQNLHQAQNLYRNALEYIVESLNIQKQIEATYSEISKLKVLKDQLTPEE